jgi:hypothetical protein
VGGIVPLPVLMMVWLAVAVLFVAKYSQWL